MTNKKCGASGKLVNKKGSTKTAVAVTAIIVAVIVLIAVALIFIFVVKPSKNDISTVQESVEVSTSEENSSDSVSEEESNDSFSEENSSTQLSEEDSNNSSADEMVEGETKYISTGKEQVVADGDVKITYTSVSELVDSSVKYINFKIENNSSHRVAVGFQNLEINNYNLYSFFVAELEAGESKNASFGISQEQFELNNIDEIRSILVGFKIYNSDDTSEYELTDKATILIYDGDAPSADENTENFQLLKESDGVSIYYKEFKKYSDEASSFIFYIENNSDKDVSLSSDTKVNGTEISEGLNAWCDANSIGYSEIMLNKEYLDNYGIDSVENIELTITCEDVKTNDVIWQSDSFKFDAK